MTPAMFVILWYSVWMGALAVSAMEPFDVWDRLPQDPL